ncbi:ABC transporter substrate-binding protein [Hoyosella sp. G463]|uniref:ABC transporter substrate-binding protein n=1 Tax=Lolliginicoccus lacisalsi TaxID=2742202 RepID=A0A927PKI1_9ACTN|nr:ABC transporter substrate-binding protein [Lolliginicoccus lacisalsi]MBD8505743.1 ABC transporter substrate-binding protein [Lolliginicoccus lacisalsi]
MTGFRPLNRRAFLGYTGIAAAGLALTACAGGGSGTSSGDPSTIQFWSNHPGTSRDTELELIRRFEAANPGLTVQLVSSGRNYEEVAQKFNASLAGGDLPDVVVLSDVWWFNYALNNTIEPLDGLFDDLGVDTGSYVEALLADYAFNGNRWAVPYARSTPLFYYNRDAWQEAGLPDRGPRTWDEMAEWAPELVGANGDRPAHSWANGAEYLAWYYQGVNWTFDGRYSDDWTVTIADEQAIEAAEWFRGTIHDGRWANITPDNANDFGAGLCASTLASTGSLAQIQAAASFEVGTAFLPRTEGRDSCPTGGAGLAIPAGIPDERKRNAMRFIEFITNPENTGYFSQNVGYMPVRSNASEIGEFREHLDANPNARTAVEQLPLTSPQDNARVFVPGSDQFINGGLERIGLRNENPADVLPGVRDQLQGIIDRQITPKLPN